MRKATFYTIPFVLALAAPPAVTPSYAHEPLYKNGRQILLIAPDGALLDYVPEAGSVMLSRDANGRQILLDANGSLVATEIYADEYRPANAGYETAPGFDRQRGGNWGERPFGQNGQERWSRDFGGQNAYPPPPANDFPAAPQTATPDRPDTGAPVAKAPSKPDMNVVATQVFLDRKGFSPGVIDGLMGDNVRKALDAYAEATGERLDPFADSETIMQALSLEGGLPFTTYTITATDAAGPYVAAIPSDYAEKAELPELSYTSVSEMLAEKFHMDEGFLKTMNPEADFSRPGTTIKIINIGKPQKTKVATILADKARKQLRAYDAEGTLIAAYPATIGSSDTPSPSGTVSVERIAIDPNYTYNPHKNFKQGDNNQVLTINPGPNGPVGNVWIALSKPSYGIHGTPDPDKIGKTSSHGCVRLTNWDANELAHMVSPGTTVEFID
ncbi:L,D-transpeptidase [Martelella soudanensis]|uniref:L,D-transpeptidase n=1 Tax=unclassified Martelella TaxID=2629616 RepID=UPI0015E02CAF|nr:MULTISPECIES: L,D-transpeptidase [unclassified Martelella]